MRLISSQSFQPTSPSQSSLVPGRNAKRNGFRKPYATMRRRFASLAAAFGLSAAALPVDGSSRSSEPFRTAGPAARFGLCARSAPPSAVGGVSDPPGGSAHGFPFWP